MPPLIRKSAQNWQPSKWKTQRSLHIWAQSSRQLPRLSSVIPPEQHSTTGAISDASAFFLPNPFERPQIPLGLCARRSTRSLVLPNSHSSHSSDDPTHPTLSPARPTSSSRWPTAARALAALAVLCTGSCMRFEHALPLPPSSSLLFSSPLPSESSTPQPSAPLAIRGRPPLYPRPMNILHSPRSAIPRQPPTGGIGSLIAFSGAAIDGCRWTKSIRRLKGCSITSMAHGICLAPEENGQGIGER